MILDISVENAVFRKIREISAFEIHPRPFISTIKLANELFASTEKIMPYLLELKKMRLVSFNDGRGQMIRLTHLGSVVIKEDK